MWPRAALCSPAVLGRCSQVFRGPILCTKEISCMGIPRACRIGPLKYLPGFPVCSYTPKISLQGICSIQAVPLHTGAPQGIQAVPKSWIYCMLKLIWIIFGLKSGNLSVFPYETKRILGYKQKLSLEHRLKKSASLGNIDIACCPLGSGPCHSWDQALGVRPLPLLGLSLWDICKMGLLTWCIPLHVGEPQVCPESVPLFCSSEIIQMNFSIYLNF